MSRSRSAFARAVASGPFAIVYWTTFGLAAIAVIAGLFGSREQRIVTGAVVFSLVVILGVARYVVAARIERRADDPSGGHSASSPDSAEHGETRQIGEPEKSDYS